MATYPHGGVLGVWADEKSGQVHQPIKAEIRDYLYVLQSRVEGLFAANVVDRAYETTDAALADTSNGDIFAVFGSDSATVYRVYQNQNGSASLVKEVVNPDRIEDAVAATEAAQAVAEAASLASAGSRDQAGSFAASARASRDQAIAAATLSAAVDHRADTYAAAEAAAGGYAANDWVLIFVDEQARGAVTVRQWSGSDLGAPVTMMSADVDPALREIAVMPGADDALASAAIISFANGARHFPLPFATIQAATAASAAGDFIRVYPGSYTEAFEVKGGRTYQCDPGVVLANCVLTYDGDTAEGPLDWRGHAQVIRTTEPLSSFNIDDGRDCVLELLGGVRDENYASTFYTIDWNRTNLHLKTGHCSTVLRSLFSADDQWDAQAMLGKSVIEASSVESTYAARNTSSTIYVLIRADRGTTLDVYVDSITTPANEALSIGSLVDPGSAKATTINLKRGRIDTPNQAVLFYSIGADSGSDYVLTLSSGVVVKSGASPMTRTQGAASNPRVEVHGVATASSGPDSAVSGPTKGILQIEGAL
jgi:hypothetical protein